VDASETNAAYCNGILVITLPLVPDEQRIRKVPVGEQRS
jgi:hypothetical protein